MRPADVQTVEQADDAIQLLGKWRMHFAGWLLGTRPKNDPQSQWVRDNTEKLLVLRAEVSAITSLLVGRKVFTREEFTVQVGQEAQALVNALEARWPGIKTTEDGLEYSAAEIVAAGWMKDWLP